MGSEGSIRIPASLPPMLQKSSYEGPANNCTRKSPGDLRPQIVPCLSTLKFQHQGWSLDKLARTEKPLLKNRRSVRQTTCRPNMGRRPRTHLSENGNKGNQRETEALQADMFDWDACPVHGNDHGASACRPGNSSQPEWTRSIDREPERTNKIGCWRQPGDMQGQLRSMH